MEIVSPDLHSEVDDLVRNLTDGLHIDNADESDVDGISSVTACEQSDPVSDHRRLCKSAAFQCHHNTSLSTKLSDEEDDQKFETASRQVLSEESVKPACSRTVFLPTPRKSAMKGSRERQGITPSKMNVKWAPEVYDPVPTLVSHTVRSGKQKKQHKSDNYKKKNGKKGQRNNLAKASSSGGRKKHRKSSGSSTKCYEPLSVCNRLVDQFDVLDSFETDSTCGTSFLKESANQLHYAIAQAL
jgi:hypothetical protein